MSTQAIQINDPSIKFECLPDSLSGYGWAPGVENDVASMGTRGNGCYMEYRFNGIGVLANIYLASMHGPFGCSIDGQPLRWFSANPALSEYGLGCAITGLASGEHTLRIFNSPMPGWWLRVNNLTVITGGTSSIPSFSSDYPAYPMPRTLMTIGRAQLNATINAETCKPVGSGGVSVAVFVAIVTVLFVVFVSGGGLAIRRFFHRRHEMIGRRMRPWTAAAMPGGTPAQPPPTIVSSAPDQVTVHMCRSDSPIHTSTPETT